MATIAQVISDVRRQVSGLRLTDENRLLPEHVFFVLNYCASKAEATRIAQFMSSYGGFTGGSPYSSMYKEVILDVDQSSMEATLPEYPIALPFDQGLPSVYYYDENRREFYSAVPVNPNRAANSKNMWFRNFLVTRIGNKLRLINMDGVSQIRVLLLSSELPRDANGSLDINAQFPVSEDLLADVVQMAVAILSRAYAMPEDIANDAKDNPNL